MGDRNPDVDAWFDRDDNPLKNLVQAVWELDRGQGRVRLTRGAIRGRGTTA